MRRLIATALLLTSSLSHAQQAGVELLTLEHEDQTYPYAVYRSADLDPQAPAPMVVFLHGSGECGTDGTKQLAVGLLPAVFLDSQRWPAVILLPQKPTVESAWEDHDEALLAMIDRTIRAHNVDADRVALTGLSQGGHGSFVIAARHSELFCAVAPICGYIGWNGEANRQNWPPDWITDPQDPSVQEIAKGLGKLPVWAIHGDADNAVPHSQSVLVIDTINAQHPDADTTLTILPGVGHNSWDHAYRRLGLAEWLLQDRSHN